MFTLRQYTFFKLIPAKKNVINKNLRKRFISILYTPAVKFLFIEQIISHKYEFFHPNKKGGVYSTPTSMSVSFLNRNVILLSLCTVAVSKSVCHNPSSQVSRTRGCFSIVPMKMRSSRSRCIWLSRSTVAAFSRSTAVS